MKSWVCLSLVSVCALAFGGASAETFHQHHMHRAHATTTTPKRQVVSLENWRRPLSGEQISQLFVTNTITGVEKSETYFEYIKPDGRISGVSDSGAYGGDWRVVGDRFCLRYDHEDEGPSANDKWEWDCEPVTRKDDRIFWSDEVEDGATPDATLFSGNPKNL